MICSLNSWDKTKKTSSSSKGIQTLSVREVKMTPESDVAMKGRRNLLSVLSTPDRGNFSPLKKQTRSKNSGNL